jgi:5-methylcytosine-specific restriction endonuclease McrA
VHEWKLRTNPGYLRRQVFDRDKGVCAGCGLDCEKLGRILRAADMALHQYGRYWMDRSLWALFDSIIRPIYGGNGYATLWEADHIVPVAEGGGQCGLDNIRTLCLACHQKETAALRKRLKHKQDGGDDPVF